MKKLIWGINLLCFVAGATAASAATIDFNIPSLPGGSKLINSYFENGFEFTGSFAHTDNLISGRPYDGTAYIQLLYGSNLTMRSANGNPFQLSQIDLAEYSTVFPYPMAISFTGYKSGGGIVTQSFIIDGLITANPSLGVDFQTFYFDATFDNLDYIVTNSRPFSLDNVVASPVPLPLPGYLLGMGIANLLLLRKFV